MALQTDGGGLSLTCLASHLGIFQDKPKCWDTEENIHSERPPTWETHTSYTETITKYKFTVFDLSNWIRFSDRRPGESDAEH